MIRFVRPMFACIWALAVIAFTAVHPRTAFGQAPTVALTQVKVQGSEPPDFSNWNGCVRSLGGKPYNESAANRCLSSILTREYFTGGQIQTEPYGKGEVRVVFVLNAPSLVLSRLDINVSPNEREKLMKWLSMDARTLRLGDVYQRDGEFATWFGIDNFYRFEGQHVGISETLHLNYRERTAELSYEILEGPSSPRQAMLPPYGPPCKEIVGILNLTGADDFVPIPFVLGLTKTQPFSCFKQDSVLYDQKVLENSGLFTKVQYSVSGPPNYKQIDVTILGEPLMVKDVSIQPYGEAIGITPPGSDRLSVRVGSIYLRASAAADMDYLKGIYSKSGETVDVFEDENVLPENGLRVKYSVLAYDTTQFFVDGQKIDSNASKNSNVAAAKLK